MIRSAGARFGLVACLAWGAHSLGAQGTTRFAIEDELGFPTDISVDDQFALVNTRPYGRSSEQNPSELQLRDLRNGSTTSVATGRSPFGRPAAVFSRDGRHAAYVWTEPVSEPWSVPLLRTAMMVVGTDAKAPARLLVAPDGNGVVPHDWSPDGQAILALVHGPGANVADPTSLAWVSFKDGAIRQVSTLEPWRRGASFARPRLSPDGLSIAYAAIERPGSDSSQIYIVAADGSGTRQLTELPGSNATPVWTPDGRHVVFVNSHDGQRDLMAVAVSPASQAPPVTRLRSAFSGDLLRMSRAGRLFYVETGNDVLTYQVMVQVNPSGAQVIDAFPGLGGSWFGQDTLAVVRLTRTGNDVVVRSLTDRTERVFSRPGVAPMPPRWVGDGSALVVYVRPAGDNGHPGGAFYRIDLANGNFVRLLSKDSPQHERSTVAAVSPDGETLYVATRPTGQEIWTSVVGMDLATGQERLIADLPVHQQRDSPGLAVSPDGTRLAVQTEDGRIMTVPTRGGEFTEIHGPVDGGGWPDLMRWTGDSRAVVFAVSGPADMWWRLMTVPAVSGRASAGLESTKLVGFQRFPRFEIGTIISLDLNADGTIVTFSTRAVPHYNVGVIEDVMTILRSTRFE